ncbi:MAG: hypothetical protein ABSG86_29195 [Thermoguttaceae bacterium]|jgi:Leucine-rich repeat (LRR) protein
MTAALGRIVRRGARFIRAWGIAVFAIGLAAAVLLVANLAGRTRYFVEQDDWQVVYGAPYPYRTAPKGLGEIHDSDPPYPWQQPLLPFDARAAALDILIGAIIMLLVVALVVGVLRRPWARRWLRRRTLLVAGAVLLVAAALGFSRAKAAYEARHELLIEIARCDGATFGGVAITELPGPDVLWSAIQWLASPWYSPDEVGRFLDASVGTTVWLQCPKQGFPFVAKLSTLVAIDLTHDPVLIPTDVPGSFQEEPDTSERGRVTPETSPRLERVSVRGVNADCGVLWDVIELPHLRFLRIAASRLNVALSGKPALDFLQRLHLLTQLEGLEIEDCDIGDGLVGLAELRNLRVLSLRQAYLTRMAETLREIGSLPRLQKLSLAASAIDDEGVKPLENLSSLRSLDLSDDGITDAAGKSLARLIGLRFLEISCVTSDNNPRVSDAILKDLALLPELDELHMQGARVTDAGFAALGRFRQLRKLDLTCAVASFRGLPAPFSCPSLESLDLSCSYGVDNRIGPVVCCFANLKSLDLSATEVDDRIGPSIRALSALESLSLGSTRVDDGIVAELQQLGSLRWLDLASTKVTDNCIPGLLAMNSLRVVHLGGTAVTRDGVAQLHALKNLRGLTLDGCPAISGDDLQYLKELMPKVDFMHPTDESQEYWCRSDGQRRDALPETRRESAVAVGGARGHFFGPSAAD